MLLLIAAALGYVHVSLQPAIDRLFAAAGGNVLSGEAAARVQTLRLRRKRVAAFCVFAVLTMILLGVQVWAAFPARLTLTLVAAIALFTWRVYSSVTPFGWV